MTRCAGPWTNCYECGHWVKFAILIDGKPHGRVCAARKGHVAPAPEKPAKPPKRASVRHRKQGAGGDSSTPDLFGDILDARSYMVTA